METNGFLQDNTGVGLVTASLQRCGDRPGNRAYFFTTVILISDGYCLE